MEERMETTKLTNEQPTAPSKYKALGAAMAVDLMIGFWFGIGVILSAKMVNSVDYCLEELTANKMAEQNQVQHVTTKEPKKAKASMRLAEYNRRKREELAQMKSSEE